MSRALIVVVIFFSLPLFSDEKSNLVLKQREETFFKPDGKIFARNVFIFNTDGTLSEYQKYDKNNAVAERVIHSYMSYTKYTPDNKYTGYVKYHGYDKLFSKVSYLYDKEGNNTEAICYNSNDTVFSRCVLKNLGGRKIQETWYHKNNLFFSDVFIKYDSKGNRSEVVTTDAKGVIVFRIADKYDAKGLITESITNNQTNSLYLRKVFSYDPQGHNTDVVIYNLDGSLNSSIGYKYDSSGRRIEYCLYNSVNVPEVRTVYEYDLENNLIKMSNYKYLTENGIQNEVFQDYALYTYIYY